MMGEPNRSQRIMVTKTRKPSPMNSPLPHGRACGASLLGQSIKGPSGGREAQDPLPPAQFFKPDSMSLTPMSNTVGPVTSGGKRRFRYRVLVNESPISSSAQRHDVARSAP
ncbi:hypothetical protein I7I48_07380 [Histoplasma ohiense]|nr:hypothetical protein I7I48_07380 [Histoplasma ohiense (nom. inval.)]